MIKPLKGQCLIELQPINRILDSGVLLPSSYEGYSKGQKKPLIVGIVINMGQWHQAKTGHHVIPEFKIGDKVLCNPYIMDNVPRDAGENLRLVNQQDVVAVFDRPSDPA
jgi:co-chaperonin GroES (HSP10)